MGAMTLAKDAATAIGKIWTSPEAEQVRNVAGTTRAAANDDKMEGLLELASFAPGPVGAGAQAGLTAKQVAQHLEHGENLAAIGAGLGGAALTAATFVAGGLPKMILKGAGAVAANAAEFISGGETVAKADVQHHNTTQVASSVKSITPKG